MSQISTIVSVASAGITIGATVVAVATVNGPQPGPNPEVSNQFTYQADLANDRRSLFDGDLYARTDRVERVATWFPVTVVICGQANSDPVCATPTEDQGPGASPATMPALPAKTVKLGGRVGVTLAAADDAVTIKDLSNAEDETQPLVSPTDYASWTWYVRAAKPGRYFLSATVSLKVAGSDADLVTRQSVTIGLTVEQTAANAAKQVGSGTWKVVSWLLGVIVALAGVGLLTRAGIRRWFSRRGSRGAEQESQAVASSSADP
ncbi:hypothetical protein [Micromonospora sp. DT233]|uniref:hypothetical protein n=1 Tax=Micromonospora sp. DT233 TaxID=3393432 RepID=UPI003CF3755C